MATYTQDSRNLQVLINGLEGADDSGNDKVLLAAVLPGSFEALSEPYQLRLQLLSPVTSSALKVQEMLGKKITVKIMLENNQWRYFDGIINQFQLQGYYTYQTQNTTALNKDLYQYHVLMTPKLELLKRNCVYKVFHSMDAKGIVKSILGSWNIDFEDQTSSGTGVAEKSYTLEQVFQYGESDFNFITRLMEREGIFYSFVHEMDKSNVPQHKMILQDMNTADRVKLSYDPEGADNEVQVFEQGEEIGANSIRLDDYDFRDATKWFFTGDDQMIGQKTDLHQVADMMRLDNPYAQFSETAEAGDDADYRTKLKTIGAQRERAGQFRWRGTTRNRGLEAGNGITLNGYISGDVNGLITGLYFELSTTPYAIEDASVVSDSQFGFNAEFTAQDISVPFRPQLTVKAPEMGEVQSANVITVENFPPTEKRFTYDLGGNMIWVNSDTYRVKVLFRWNNTKADGNPDYNSMWAYARFSQLWATSNSGKFDIPRKGQEVLITFSKGNHGQPLVIGSAYNSAIGPPADLSVSRAYYANVLRSAAVTQEGGSQASGGLAITPPVPYTVNELGQQSNQLNYNEIGIYSMDNGYFTDPGDQFESEFWYITQYLFPSAAPTLQQLVNDVRKLTQEQASTGGDTTEHFEGINLYSNKSVFCQSTQDQIFNSGKDIYIQARNSIQIQVGRATITLKDEGIVVQCAAGTPNTTKAYISDYRGSDVNQSGPGVSLPLFNSALSVLPGRAAMRAPNCSVSGMYSSSMGTWFGSSFSSFIGSSSIRGLTTSLKAGANWRNVFTDIQGLVNQGLNVVNTNVSDSKATVGLASAQAGSGLISQGMLIYTVIETVVSNVKALRGYFSLRSSSINMEYDKVKVSTSEAKIDGLKVSKNGNWVAPFAGTIEDLAAAGTGGNGPADEAADQLVNSFQDVADMSQDETNVAENRERSISESHTNGTETEASVNESEGTVQESAVSGAEQQLSASQTEGELSNQSTTVDNTTANVTETDAAAMNNNVAGLGTQTDGLSTETGGMVSSTDGLNINI
ncbi:type VI secretion system tip protein TssI/VgrG [Lentisphaerota bacterium ZTH]|nr:type VI secretion system tip protein VgrG [Lentisphaerota bacterium]WET05212.1 type VI secretion system tip protein TssI/VgrG [Lentisphaerota bacterium ZTH]